MGSVIRGQLDRAYTFPRSVTAVGKCAFQGSTYGKRSLSVKFNDGLETLGNFCFQYSQIRSLVVPAGVRSIGECAFNLCS